MQSGCMHKCTYTTQKQGDFRDPGRTPEASQQSPPRNMVEASPHSGRGQLVGFRLHTMSAGFLSRSTPSEWRWTAMVLSQSEVP